MLHPVTLNVLKRITCGLWFSFVFQGNLFDFLRLTGWRGSKVLYFGDHLYSDLAVSVWLLSLWLIICSVMLFIIQIVSKELFIFKKRRFFQACLHDVNLNLETVKDTFVITHDVWSRPSQTPTQIILKTHLVVFRRGRRGSTGKVLNTRCVSSYTTSKECI